MERMEQHSSEEINDNKNVRIRVVKGRKIAITTASAKPIIEKLLTVSTKMALLENS